MHAVVPSSQPLGWLHHDRMASAALEFSLAQGEGLLNSVDMIAGFGRVRGAAMLDRPVGGSQEEDRACFKGQ